MADCFIIMPISTPEQFISSYGGDKDHFLHVLEHLFVPAIEKIGLNPIRPIAEGSDIIHARIIENIEKTDLIICDMSILNPNVFFELGIRTAVDKPVCMVVDDLTEKIPFDTSIINYHTYNSSLAPWILEKEVESLSQHLKKVHESGETNSLWKYFGLSSKAKFSEEENTLESKVDLITMEISGIKRQLLSSRVEQIDIQKDSKSRLLEIELMGALEKSKFKDFHSYNIDIRHREVHFKSKSLPPKNVMNHFNAIIASHGYQMLLSIDEVD